MSRVQLFMNIVVLAGTNCPDILYPALIQPGQFDCLIYMGKYACHFGIQGGLHVLVLKITLDHYLCIWRQFLLIRLLQQLMLITF